MKTICIVALLIGINTSVYAQAVSHGKWEENDHPRKHRPATVEQNELTGTEISVENKMVTISGLPRHSRVSAIVTDANGTQLEQQVVSPSENTMDLRRLRKGELYFLTILHDKSRKAFVLHL